MREVFITIEPKTLLRAGRIKPKTDYLDTLPYLHGSLLRGSLAEWLKVAGREDEIEEVVKNIKFGNFFPSFDGDTIALPIPSTAIECKVQGGFLSEGGHGIRDTLLIALAYLELKKLGAKIPIPLLVRCKRCKGRMERTGGFYVNENGNKRKVNVELAVQTKVASSRLRRVAQEHLLYRVLALRPKYAFIGRVWFKNENDFLVLSEAIEKMGIGAMTTRGYGKVKIRKANVTHENTLHRLNRFNEKLAQVWADLANFAKKLGSDVPEKPNSTYFSIDLISPAILKDKNNLPTLKLTLRINDQLLEPIFWSTQAEFIGGWSTAWGLPKPTSLGASMGSVYVFRTEQTVDEIVEKLETLEANGVGKNTDEGLGEILVCHPFHLEVDQV